MSVITTHVLDTSLGKPAAGIAVTLHRLSQSGETEQIAAGKTDSDGRISDLVSDRSLALGTYLLSFDTAAYFETRHTSTFYPRIDILFELATTDHYHVPLLLSPFGYSTYRGS